MKSDISQSVTSFQWAAFPAKKRVKLSIIGGMIILALAISIYYSFNSWILTLLTIFVLVLRLNRFYFPSSFSIDKEGITANYFLRSHKMNWNEIKRIVTDEFGAYLSKSSNPSRWDAFRGMHILFGNDRNKVMEILNRRNIV